MWAQNSFTPSLHCSAATGKTVCKSHTIMQQPGPICPWPALPNQNILCHAHSPMQPCYTAAWFYMVDQVHMWLQDGCNGPAKR